MSAQQKQEPLVIVVGGSAAGLMTAAMFGEYAKVIVIEKDLEPTADNFHMGRPGTLQDRHFHSILQGGYEVICKHFPGFGEALLANGANIIDRCQDVSWFHAGVWKLRYEDGGKYRMIPRPSIDKTFRECLKTKYQSKPEQITWMYGKRVVDLLINEDAAVNGVKLDDGTMLMGTLVVDAAGKLGGVAKHLAKHGFDSEPRKSVNFIDLTYSTQVFEYPGDYKFDAQFILCHPDPAVFHGVGTKRVAPQTVTGGKPDHQYLFCTQLGYGTKGRVASQSTEEFLALLKELPAQQTYDLLSKGKPLYDKPFNYLSKEQVKKHWEEMALPDGFISVGDAVCAFNPTYSQGISHAVMGIDHLQPLVQGLVWGKSCDKARRILADESFVPFLMNSIEDFRFKGTEGERIWGLPIIQMFAWWMYRAQEYSPEVSSRVWPVAHLQASPLSMLNLMFILRVIWYGSGLHKFFFGSK